MELTQKKLKELLHYNKKTGIFTRKIGTGGQAIGSIAGFKDKNYYYWIIKVDGISYKAHRLAWLYVTGEMPIEFIDHKNQIRYDNRWENLREADALINGRNQKKHTRNNSGFNGVWFRRNRKTWVADIVVNGKKIYLGSSKNKEIAIQLREDANVKYGFYKNHGS